MAILGEETMLKTSAMLGKKDSLAFITGYKYADNILRTFLGMTFFYDANWGGNISSRRTFPIAFFHLKGIHEVMDSEVQTKKMMFYNSQDNYNLDSATGGIINVIADNIVNKPKSYKLDVIVPYENLTMLFNSMILSSYQMQGAMSAITGTRAYGLASSIKDVTTKLTDGTGGILTKGIEKINTLTASMLTASIPYITLVKELINGLLSVGGFTGTDWITSLMSTPSYNKNSLEAMWRNRTILKLKLWNGWDFKYVVITNIDITKESTEYGVEEATITCTELPIMTMRNKQSNSVQRKSSWLASWENAKTAGGAIATGASAVGGAVATGARWIGEKSVALIKSAGDAIANLGSGDVSASDEGLGIKIRL